MVSKVCPFVERRFTEQMDRFFFEASGNVSVFYADFSRGRFTAVIASHIYNW